MELPEPEAPRAQVGGGARRLAVGVAAACAVGLAGAAALCSAPPAPRPLSTLQGAPAAAAGGADAAMLARARKKSWRGLVGLEDTMVRKMGTGDLCPGYASMDDCPSKFPMPYAPGQYPPPYDYSGSFPDGFVLGMGTAAYQIEGAYNEDGRGASIWDTFSGANTVGMPGAGCTYCCSKPPCDINKAVADKGSTGNVAVNHYHMYKTDIAMMKSMGLKYYRFSISWPRIIPTGKYADGVNQKGIDFYDELIDSLIAAGITPYVTLYHWDLPQGLLDPQGTGEEGWWSRDKDGKPDGKIIPHWLDFVRVCFDSFGDRVSTWVTFNEPWTFIWLGSGWGKAPSIDYYSDMSVDTYIAAHNMLNAHAQAVHLYRTHFNQDGNGRIGITNCADWREPATDTPADIAAAERALIVRLAWFSDPIFGPDGDYPPEMRRLLGDALPKFTDEEKALLKGSADFFGINHYGTGWAHFDSTDAGGDKSYASVSEENLEQAQSAWLYSAGWGFRKLLVWIKNRYDNPPTMVTEGGWSLAAKTAKQAVKDAGRTKYYADYMSDMRKAIYEDKCNVLGYFAWSLLDNYEWEQGYKERFGVNYNDYNFGLDPNGPLCNQGHQPRPFGQWRQRKDSSCWFEAVTRENGLVDPKDPQYRCTCSAVFRGEFVSDAGCPRTIKLNGQVAVITGKEPGAAVPAECDGSTDRCWKVEAKGFVSGGTIVMDFSPVGGPSHIGGFWDADKEAIHWGDGTSWRAVKHGTCHAKEEEEEEEEEQDEGQDEQEEETAESGAAEGEVEDPIPV